MNPTNTSPQISWDFGTAYELFISLHVLHQPEYFGIRPSYAASVRARIPAEERKLLEEVFKLMGAPLTWISTLPDPKDAISALWALKQIPPSQRMIKLQGLDCEIEESDDPAETEKHRKFNETLLRIADEGKWYPEDADYFMKTFGKKHGGLKRETMESVLERWSHPEELGEGYLSAIQSYYQAFFEEEEKRIEPMLRAGLEQAQQLEATMSFEELFAELSQGLQMGSELNATKYILAPAFWSTPLVFFERIDKDTMLLLFGARPSNVSVMPGEVVPDALVRSLKALADPTRLKILHYLTNENLTPSEIARKLQLRPPTVTHHLKELRLAGLVELSLAHEENRYTARRQALNAVYQNLTAFLEGEKIKEPA
ncbi:MAG: winged helix-turn-helix transcriptional regulator [Anaerolineales bacterium]|nr:winged helix-turn-helix transcriptional regulator [Anaerolineales bacterium]MCB9109888.1 winged helix-turn-helix transcriptional regulator [Anaerolineales bacterium]